MDFVANFQLNKNDLEANFELNPPVQFDALFEINPAGTSWGSITGTLSNQEDLQNALDLKADKSEVEEDITTLDNKIDDVQSDLSGDISALTQTVENNNTAINNRVDGVVDSFDADIEEINTNISTLNTNLTAEISNRATADSGLQTQLNSVKQTADSAIQPNDNITLLNNNAGYITSADLPTVNNSTITIQSNNVTVGDFNLNQANNETINIAVPTKTSDITNDSGYITNADLPTLEDLTTTEQLNAINSGATTSKIGQIATNTSNISSLSTTVTNNYNTLDGRITSEVSALNTAIGAETTNRQNADNALQSQIDAIVSSSDVFDIVGTYTELQAYDISTVPVNDIIKVLVDSTHNNAATYYRCTETGGVKSWTYIGAEGAYYTKSEADNKFVEQTTTINNKPLSSNITLTASDVGALPSSTVIGSGVLTIQKNGSDVDTFSANATSNKSINITVPTKTSDITNDSNFATVSQIPTNNNQLTNGAGYITGITSSDVTTALGYTPYDSSNPSGYTSNVGTVTSVNNVSPVNGDVSLTIPTVNDGTITINQGNTQKGVFTVNQSGNTTINLDGNQRNIGEIVISTIPLTDAGLHLLDGALINGSGSYSEFVDYIAGLVIDYPDLFVTESDWQTAVTTYGVCGKFVYDSVNNTVRLPKITGIVEGTTDLTALGDLVQAGLPNITGVAGTFQTLAFSDCTGAFKGVTPTGTGATATTGTGSYSLAFDASRSSSIYGNSTTVQPQTIKVLYYIVIATSTKTEIQVDIDEIATDLNGKADADLSNVPTSKAILEESYVNGRSWYRVYSDGWCEQGGIGDFTSNSSVALLKNYVNTNYCLFFMRNAVTAGSSSTGGDWWARSKTTSSFSPYTNQLTAPPYAVAWRACGYIR